MCAKKLISQVGHILNSILNQQTGSYVCCLAQKETIYLALSIQIPMGLPLFPGP